jgi:hypothetical protein
LKKSATDQPTCYLETAAQITIIPMFADYFSLSAPSVHKVSQLQFLVVKLFSSVLGFTFPSIPSTVDSAHSASGFLACFVLFGELDLLESSLTSHPAALTASLKCCSL